MPRHERTGNRKPREHLANQRVPKLGYYFIVTDTKETEQNYMYGLRDSIPKELQGKLVIKVVKTKTKNPNQANNNLQNCTKDNTKSNTHNSAVKNLPAEKVYSVCKILDTNQNANIIYGRS